MIGGWPDSGAQAEWARRVFAMRREQPHYKPALLLAALDLMDRAEAEPGRVPADRLAKRFDEILRAAGLEGNALMPLWHLAEDSPTHEPFWRIVMRDGRSPSAQPRAVGPVAYVSFLPAFVPHLAVTASRWSARQAVYALLDADGRTEPLKLLTAWREHLDEMETAEARVRELAAGPFRLDDDDASMVSESRTAVVRDRAFRKVVRQAYEHRCALCSDRIRWRGASLVEAGHVKPRSLRGADDVRNGLALCPSHHWSFDRFLWTIDEQLRVRVREPTGGADLGALDRFREGASLRLPPDDRFRVHPEAVAWHAAGFKAVG